MKEKEKVDYIYFSCVKKARRKVDFQREESAGIFVLKINYYKKEKKGRNLITEESNLPDKICKKIRRIVRKYQADGCVLGADDYMGDKLKISELGFEARKHEMLQQKEYIFKKLKVEKREGRRSVALILDSKNWDGQEILSLLLTMKDYYEELYVVSGQENLTELNRIAEFLYIEWGIVLHIQLKESFEEIRGYDFILFLLKKWDNQIINKYKFRGAYIVMDVEEKILRKRVITNKAEDGYLYAGLFYEKQHLPVSYQMAVDILYQNPVLYGKLAVSYVDICCLECYNRK